MIEARLADFGFREARVSGQGAIRYALGIWGKEDQEAEASEQVLEWSEL